MNDKDNTGSSALSVAFRFKHDDVIHLLISRGAELEPSSTDTRSYFERMVSMGSMGAIIPLLEKGVDPKMRLSNGKTALMVASENGRVNVMKPLVQAGVDINEEGDLSTVSMLLDRGVRPDVDVGNGKTALMKASRLGNAKLVGMLTKAGSDLKAKDKEGNTALMFAAEAGDLETIQSLLNSGADRSEKNAHEEAAFDIASRCGRFDIARLLFSETSGAGAMISQNEVDKLLLRPLLHWKGVIESASSSLRNKSFNAMEASFVIIGIFNRLNTLAVAFNGIRNEAIRILPFADGIRNTKELHFPSADKTCPEDIRWAAAHFDIAKGAVFRLMQEIKRAVRELPGAEVQIPEIVHVHTRLPNGTEIAGGPGDSVQNALIVKSAPDHKAGVLAEREYLQRVIEGPFDSRLGSHFEQDGRLFDALLVMTPGGPQKEFFFDITDFYGEFSAISETPNG